jgi:hypothetical protein
LPSLFQDSWARILEHKGDGVERFYQDLAVCYLIKQLAWEHVNSDLASLKIDSIDTLKLDIRPTANGIIKKACVYYRGKTARLNNSEVANSVEA